MKSLRNTIVCSLLLVLSITAVAQETGKTINVSFAKGATVTLKGTVKNGYIDYAFKAGAGQTLAVTLKGTNSMNYMNVLAPGSVDDAMFIGSSSGNSTKRLLPDDGTYKVRVYLMRAASRRGESSRFTLSLSLTGKRILPIAGGDALVPGTRFHAQAEIPCTWDLDQKVKTCKASVVRRGRDGTATLELRWGSQKRLILFIKGKPAASDSTEKITAMRNGDETTVKFSDQETFTVPDALIFGG